MIFTRSLALVLILTVSSSIFAQDYTSQDSITKFYTALFENLEKFYLDREAVDWEPVKTYAFEQALKTKSFEQSLNVASDVFDTIRCNHCKLFSESGFYGSTLNKALSQEDFSYQFLQELEKQPPFNVQLLNDNIGYIHIPGMLLIDLTQDSLNRKTQEMYDKVAKLAQDKRIRGWVIDVRFNIGGNVYPMLAALHYLIGDNVVYQERVADGTILSSNRLQDGGFYSGQQLEAKARTSIKPNLEVPVAVITGKMTGSAGEDIAIAFKNRKHTVFIGEESYGLLTGNDLAELPYNNQMAYTTCYLVDAQNVYRTSIMPDMLVKKGDDFEDLTKDQNIMEAIKYFDSYK